MLRFLGMVLTAIVGLSLLVGCSPVDALQVPTLNQTVPRATPIATSNPAIDFTNLEVEQWVSTNASQSWHAEGTVAVPKNSSRDQYYTELRVRNTNDNIEWTPVTEWNDFGLGYTTPRIVHWSEDERYLYFTNAPHPDGCGLFVNASDLQRLDLAAGSVEEILPFGTTRVLAAAPDGMMAHRVDSELGCSTQRQGITEPSRSTAANQMCNGATLSGHRIANNWLSPLHTSRACHRRGAIRRWCWTGSRWWCVLFLRRILDDCRSWRGKMKMSYCWLIWMVNSTPLVYGEFSLKP